MEVRPLRLIKPVVQETLVKHIESLLETAKSGEMQGMYEVCSYVGDTVDHGYVHSGFNTRRILGEMDIMKQKIIDKED